MRTSNNTCTKQRNYSWLSPSWWTHITCKKHLSQHVFPNPMLKWMIYKPESAKTHSWAEWLEGLSFWFPGLQITDTNSTVSPFPSLVIPISLFFCWKSSLHSLHPSPGASQELLGFTSSALVSAAWRPKTTKSNKELAPNRLAPCTEAQPAYVKWSDKLEMVKLFLADSSKRHEILGMIFSRNFSFVPIWLIYSYNLLSIQFFLQKVHLWQFLYLMSHWMAPLRQPTVRDDGVLCIPDDLAVALSLASLRKQTQWSQWICEDSTFHLKSLNFCFLPKH